MTTGRGNKFTIDWSQLDDISLSALLAIIISNVVILYGVKIGNWDLYMILFICWYETVLVGFFNIFRINLSERLPTKYLQLGAHKYKSKTAFMTIFLIQFGVFTILHLLLLQALFDSPPVTLTSYFVPVTISLLLLFMSHGYSYVFNYLDKKEYKALAPDQLLVRPYLRTGSVNLLLIFIALVLLRDHPEQNIALVLIQVKLIADVLAHIIEHLLYQSKNSLKSS